MTPQEAIDSLGLKIRSTFVPFSQSRNKDKPLPSLNWKVTLVRVHGADNEAGRDVLTTDYMAGAGLCPSCNIKPPASWDRPPRMWQSLAIAWECENGRRAAWTSYSGFSKAGAAKPIEPNPLDVIHSLVMDAGVLDENLRGLGKRPGIQSRLAEGRSDLEGVHRNRTATARRHW